MSADDLGADLEGLLSDLHTPAKKAAAKKTAAKKAVPTEPVAEPQEVFEPPAEVPAEPTQPIINEPTQPIINEPTQPITNQGPVQYSDGGYTGPAPVTAQPSLAELKAQLRAEVMAEVLAEFKAERSHARIEQSDRMLTAIDARHQGASQLTENPLKLPEVPEGTELPALIHFVEDGFTINGTMAFRGQEYEPTRNDPWAVLTPREQIKAYGRVIFRVGPWEGDEFDLEDPSLTEDDRQKLAAIAADRYANRLRVEPLAEVGTRRY